MPLKFAPFLRACCVVGALMVCHAIAADRKPSLVGASRADVIARFGQPKSQIVAGDRQVLFFTGERVVLRNDVVIEADEIPVETTPPPAPPSPAAAAPTDQSANAGTAGPAVGTSSAAPAPTPTAGTTATTVPSGGAATGATTGSAAATPPPPPQPEVQIISVRPPSRETSGATTPAPRSATAFPSPTPTPATVAAPPPVQPPAATSGSAKTQVPPAAAPNVPPPPATTEATSTPTAANEAPLSKPETPVATATETTTPPTEPAATATPDVSATAPAVGAGSTSAAATTSAPKRAAKKISSDEGAASNTTAAMFTTQTYVIAAVIIFGGVGYLIWRQRERRIALVATAVSRSPFATEATPAATGARFTTDLLNKLEWKRFEELVAAYYNKTGVVATRTKTGPASPVHIKISWKGETRPFASVHCIAHPTELVGAASIQALCDVLAAEDIRRGYAVTSGKFGVPARDLAEEKHITLLSGDILVEKLNALPDAARNELMKDATAGDYTTPTCPQCEAKMARAPEDPSVWKCPQCSTVLPRG